jgi:hypothetical protein
MEMAAHLRFFSRIIMVIMVIMAITGHGRFFGQNQDFLSIWAHTVLLNSVGVALGVLCWRFSGGGYYCRDEDFVPCTVDAVSGKVRGTLWDQVFVAYVAVS